MLVTTKLAPYYKDSSVQRCRTSQEIRRCTERAAGLHGGLLTLLTVKTDKDARGAL